MRGEHPPVKGRGPLHLHQEPPPEHPTMKTLITLLIALALLTTACGDDSSTEADAAGDTSSAPQGRDVGGG